MVTFIACEFLTCGPAYQNFRNSSGAELGRDRGTGVALCNKLSADAALRQATLSPNRLLPAPVTPLT
ncbi:hypothetical protein BF49_2799 [Bradyrhizobium sp.]|nr:hypothetical protein BF49_2799 [Bradyrhizobium sp.]